MEEKTERYFYGSPDEKENDVPSFSRDDFKAVIEKEDKVALKEKLHDLKEQLEIDMENEQKKQYASMSNIEEDALPSEVKYAETLHRIHEEQLLAVQEELKKKEHTSKRKNFLGTFLGF